MALLRDGELTVHGRITDASNAAFYCTVSAPANGQAHGGADGNGNGVGQVDGVGQRVSAVCVYKPVRGERPLWDFPDGTLAGRETAAYLVSAAMGTGWGLVPPTALREGPFGEGMCQIWVEPDPAAPDLLSLQPGEEPEPGWRAIGLAEVEPGRTALFVHADDERLRRLAVLDAVLNNGDRKGGHLLTAADGRLYGIDHGVTFAVPGKLRTLLWGWAGEPLAPDATDALGRLRAELDGSLGAALAPLLTPAEIAATAARVDALLKEGHHPYPSPDWPAVPWPPI
ncbi:SCO1664 family protein [Streptacidiphilus anmyonensis]|uniref:SCO1664 family protein n=1 Tax=Streptacidiphilus anmyonensis TaxID=405782 RepID=UPI0005A61A0F|nr:SCO1664 family protein [Streptacidiphilus anmyonensis]